MKVLVTGASGYVGRAVCRALLDRGHDVMGAVRAADRIGRLPAGTEGVIVGDVSGATSWEGPLRGVEAAVHLAARVHVRGRAGRRMADFREINVEGTRRLAREAAGAGVRRFVFMSSIAVNGPDSGGAELTEASPPDPATPYAVSKWEAERALAAVSAETGLPALSLRPPAVYGRGAPGSFSRLVAWIGRGLPVPVAAGHPERSMIHVENLASAVGGALDWTWDGHALCLVADAERTSVAELARGVGARIGRDARVVPVPEPVFRAAAALTGGSRQLIALGRPLLVSIRGIRDRFGWTPPITLAEGLDRSLGRAAAP